MRKIRTEERFRKIKNVISQRQFSLKVVLENIHDPHNVSAIFRTCDAVGVPEVDLIYTIEKFPKISKKTSASSNKWVLQNNYNSYEKCFENLKNDGFLIYGTAFSADAENIYNVDFSKKIAIVLGNENRGVSKETFKFLDKIIYIPMRGMIQSLNVSVAAAVILYEAQRQRAVKGLFGKSELKTEQIENLIDDWCNK